MNINVRPNSDVIRRLAGNDDVTARPQDGWVLDFTDYKIRSVAEMYERPFEIVRKTVALARNNNPVGEKTENEKLARFWLMQRPRTEMRKALKNVSVFLAVPETSEHRLFARFSSDILVTGSLFAIARDDYASFGMLQSCFHDAWATAQGNRLGAGNQRRYNATVTFETFPFPEGLTPNIPAKDYADDPRAKRIAVAAKALDEKRNAWLNPPDLVDIVPEITPTAAPGEAPRQYPDRILPKNAEAARS